MISAENFSYILSTEQQRTKLIYNYNITNNTCIYIAGPNLEN